MIIVRSDVYVLGPRNQAYVSFLFQNTCHFHKTVYIYAQKWRETGETDVGLGAGGGGR